MTEFVIHDSDVPYPVEAEGFDYQWFGYGNPDGILCRGFSEYFMVKEKKVYGLWERIPDDLKDDYDLLHSKVRLEWEVSEQDIMSDIVRVNSTIVGYEDIIEPMVHEFTPPIFDKTRHKVTGVHFEYTLTYIDLDRENAVRIPYMYFSYSFVDANKNISHYYNYGTTDKSRYSLIKTLSPYDNVFTLPIDDVTTRMVCLVKPSGGKTSVLMVNDISTIIVLAAYRNDERWSIRPPYTYKETRLGIYGRYDYIKRIWNNGLRTHIEIGRPNQTKRFTYLRGRTNSPILDVNKNPIWIKRDVI